MAKQVEKPEVMDNRFVDGTTVDLLGVEVRYCHLINPDTKYKEEWSCHAKIDPNAAVAMKKIGFGITEDEANGTYWLKVYSLVRTRAGKLNNPPELTAPDGSQLTLEPGDGSVADLKLWSKYTPPIKGKIYLPAYLEKATFHKITKKESEGVRF